MSELLHCNYKAYLQISWAKISTLIIPQIFSPARNWCKRNTWPNIPRVKLGNIREYTPIFTTAHAAKAIWRKINTIASIWGENMLGYLSLDITCICSTKLTVFLELRSRKTVLFSEQLVSADKYPGIFSRQMETIVYIFNSLRVLRTFLGMFGDCVKEINARPSKRRQLLTSVNFTVDSKWAMGQMSTWSGTRPPLAKAT